MNDDIKIDTLKLKTKKAGLEGGLFNLFSKHVNNLISAVGNEATIKEAIIKGFLASNILDPNGVRIFNNILDK